ncbi:MAG: hypothetical protein IKQ31_04805 [Clostridia bacterium]|nr:hypothetical protein [Clostridia bacterium]
MEKKFYHGSKNTTIKMLEPRVSTHGQRWVYATTNPVLSAYFGGEVNDFNFIVDVDENDIPQMYELYKGAFTECFKHKKSALYELKDSGFESGKTSFKYEYVSTKRTKVIKTVIINDLSLYLRKANRAGALKIHFYENNRAYEDMIRAHIRDRLLRFGYINMTPDMLPDEVRAHWMEYYNVLREELLKSQKYYIISTDADIKEFKPINCGEGEYVCATNNPILGILEYFSDNKYYGSLGLENTINGLKPYFEEYYTDASKDVLKNKSCFVYEVENSGFMQSENASQEFVSPNEVKVIGVEKIENLATYFVERIKAGEVDIVPYAKDAKNDKKIKQAIKDLLIVKKGDNEKLDIEQLPAVVKEHYADIVEEINKK